MLFRSVLIGGSGDDVIYRYGGNDALNGGFGADQLYGGNGNDALNGGPGNDLCRQQAGTGSRTNCERP